MTDGADVPTWQPMLADAAERVRRFVEHDDPGPLLDGGALDLAERLWTTARDADGAVPLSVATAVAELYWWRNQAGGADEDLGAALGVFTMISEVAPEMVPEAARPLLAAADDVEAALADAVDRLAAAESGADQQALDEAIDRFQALRAEFEGVEDADWVLRAVTLSDLGLALRLRGERDGAFDDVEDAVALTRAALDVPADPGHRGAFLNNAATARGTRFAFSGDLDDLDAALTLGSQALEVTADEDPAWPGRASNLGGLYRVRFDRTRDPADLDRALALSVRAAELTTDAVAAGLRWSNVSNALAARYDVHRHDDDLVQAIVAGQRAVAGTPVGHRHRPAVVANLANLVLGRHERWGATEDIDQAIALGEEALDTGGLGGPALAGLQSNLGNAYRSRHEHRVRPGDLDRSIDLSRRSLKLTDDADPYRASRLSNHAMSLLTRYERSGDTADLAAAVEAGRAAVDAAGPVHPGRSKFLSNAAVLWAAQAGAVDGPARVAALDSAIASGRAALAALAPADVDRALRTVNLAGALLDRSRAQDDAADRAAAVDLYKEAARTASAPTFVRVRAARSWGGAAAQAGWWRVAEEGYTSAVGLLDQLAARRVSRLSRQDLLRRFSLLAGDAAATAVAAGSPGTAVALLEQGRAVLWSQALDNRMAVARVGHRRPDLAGRLDEIADVLG